MTSPARRIACCRAGVYARRSRTAHLRRFDDTHGRKSPPSIEVFTRRWPRNDGSGILVSFRRYLDVLRLRAGAPRRCAPIPSRALGGDGSPGLAAREQFDFAHDARMPLQFVQLSSSAAPPCETTLMPHGASGRWPD